MKITALIDPFLEHIKALPFVQKTKVPKASIIFHRSRISWDAKVVLKTPSGETEFLVTVIKNLKYSTIDYLVHMIEGEFTPENIFIFSHYITPHWGEYLAEKGFNFVDLGGNSHVRIGDDYYHMVLGKKAVKLPESKQGIRSQGYRVIFSLLAEPDLVNSPVRTIADNAGVGKTAVAERLQILEQDKYLIGSPGNRKIIKYDQLLADWLEGYKDSVEATLTIAKFKTVETNPEKREKRYPKILRASDITWAWGGLTAAWKLTNHYRDDSTVLHVDDFYPETLLEFKAIPDEDGPLTVMRTAGPISMQGAKRNTVHPLLIYTQLVTSEDSQARNAAGVIFDEYIKPKVEGAE